VLVPLKISALNVLINLYQYQTCRFFHAFSSEDMNERFDRMCRDYVTQRASVTASIRRSELFGEGRSRVFVYESLPSSCFR